ncbi:MAG: hypothetical protein OQK44_04335 [Gammaproteobacteria bacterium]|nr:hypothetical protein [Gammaproteobacteria bacterium]
MLVESVAEMLFMFVSGLLIDELWSWFGVFTCIALPANVIAVILLPCSIAGF